MSAFMESGCDILHIAYKSPAINPHQETRRMQYCQTPDSNIYVDLLQNTTFIEFLDYNGSAIDLRDRLIVPVFTNGTTNTATPDSYY